ncbi:MAG TPA: hypothetical protein VFI84_01435 [Candidatus Saccharimonadales bacterium]|nr:hypothetical protein [Candidatus Saccharimonadales bacterium]
MAGKAKKTTKKTTKKPTKKAPTKAAAKKAAKQPSKVVEQQAEPHAQEPVVTPKEEAVETQSVEEFYLSSLAYRIRPLELLEEQSLLRAHRKRQRIKVVAGTLLIIAMLSIGILQIAHTTSPVPKTVAQSVKFPVYYPDPKKLPKGYILDTDSFANPLNQGVQYAVGYDGGKKIVFTVQTKPSDNDLQAFNNSYIPLRIDYKTPLGQAEIGAYQLQTLVSVPINNGPWVIITAPGDINPADLKQILLALKK